MLPKYFVQHWNNATQYKHLCNKDCKQHYNFILDWLKNHACILFSYKFKFWFLEISKQQFKSVVLKI